MPTIHTPYGAIQALPDIEYYSDGTVRSCIAAAPSPLEAPCGVIIPQFTANTLRKRQLPAILFHPNGMVRTVPLEEQTTVETPLGPMPAEQVTFYESGDIKRVFPLNGALSGYWTEEDERLLLAPLTLDTPLGLIEVSLVCVYFGPAGTLRSLTLWPGTTLDVPCPVGTIATRIGVAFYDSGVIRSLEPAQPASIPTQLGDMIAFDPDAVGVTGDENSLRFHQNGSLMGLKSVAHEFDVTLENGRVRRISPPLRINACDGAQREPAPVTVEWHGSMVSLWADGLPRVTEPAAQIQIRRYFPPLPSFAVRCSMGAGTW